jgi:hypothetical protein
LSLLNDLNLINRIILGLLILLPFRLIAQTGQVILSDDRLRPSDSNAPLRPSARLVEPDTLPFSPSQPFLDDFFISGQTPDTSLWFLGNDRYPNLQRRGAVNPPTLGYAVFDGADPFGGAYETTLLYGYGDLLASHFIDLAPYNASDNVKLSFFLQPQGLANQPEALDSFLVYFNDVNDNWIQVFGQKGTALKPFQQFVIPVTDPDFFHTRFQIIFRNKGTLTGLIDNWFLDYVYLGMNRSAADTTYNDVSILNIKSSLLDPFTAIPYQQFQGRSLMKAFDVAIGSVNGSLRSSTTTATITDPVGGTIFTSGNEQLLATQFPPYTQSVISFGPFSDQVLNPYSATYDLTLTLPPDVDMRPANNTYRERFRVDSLFAYDDGEADGAYGLNAPKGFGQRFEIEVTDPIVAVWICFVPVVNYNPVSGASTYMEGTSFRLNIWDDPHPDSVLYQQVAGAVVSYTDSINHFHRFPLDEPVTIGAGDTIWVGIQQVDNNPIGVGYDRTYSNGDRFYYDAGGGNWIPSGLGGTLMIRPEFRNISFNPLGIGDDISQSSLFVKSFPNPATNRRIFVRIRSELPVWEHNMIILDLQGRELGRYVHEWPDQNKIPVLLPAAVHSGMYLLRHSITLSDGTVVEKIEKLLISID